ncbi:phage tail tape measure protein [Streptomyces sp. 796.1]|uniref:phage tail tape measure protein n=1 Tax=Streptomyces sp. 796.1 TaxID=3163029 RepID=UPI0039C9928B
MPSVGYATLQIIPSVRGIGDELRRQLIGPAGDAGADAGEAAGGGLRDKLKIGAAAAGVAAGALLVAGLSKAIDQANVTSKLQAQLGATGKDASRYGRIAGELYSKGITEDIQQGADTIRAVVNAGLVPPDATNKQLKSISAQMADVANTFGTDMSMQTQAVSALLKNKLAPDASSALDVITVGMQKLGPNAEDLLETFQEYPVQLRKLGIDSKMALGLFQQGLQGGARDTDIIADAFKEFSIRAVDMSQGSQDAYKALGLNAEQMSLQIAKGGKGATAGLQTVLDKLRAIKDPVKREAAAVGLFGTQAEDLGAALFKLDPGKARRGFQDVAGSAEKLGKTLHSGPSHEIEVFKRSLEQGFVNLLGGQVLPVIVAAGRAANTYLLPPLRTMGGVLLGLIAGGKATVGWLREWGVWLLPAIVLVGGLTLALNAQAIATGIVTATFSVYRAAILIGTAVTGGFTAAQAALNAVMALNPITLVVIALVALATAVYIAWQRSETFRAGVMATWQGIQTAALWAWHNGIKPALDGFMVGLRAVGTAGLWLWRTILLPAFQGISVAARVLFAVVAVAVLAPLLIVFKAVGGIATWLWQTAIRPAFAGIVALAQLWWAGISAVFASVRGGFQLVGQSAMWLWRSAVQPAFAGVTALAQWLWGKIQIPFGYVRAGLRLMGGVFTWLWRSSAQPAFQGVEHLARWAWTSMKVAFDLTRAGVRGVGSVFTWLWRSSVQPAMSGVGAAVSIAWRTSIKPALDAGKTAVRLFADAFGAAKRSIEAAWKQLEGVTKRPVNFVIEYVYTKGIKAVWDKVAGIVKLPKMPPGPQLLEAGGTVGGGFGPARPMRVNRPTAIVGEGNPRHPEFVIPTDPKYRGRARSLWEAAGQHLAGGGILGDAKDWVKDKAKSVGSGFSDAADWLGDKIDFLTDPGKIWDKAVGPIKDRIAKIGDSQWAGLLAKMPVAWLKAAKDKVVSKAKSLFGFGGGGDIGGLGVKRWSGVVLQALELVGQPASLLPVVLRRMNQESGGNPRAINNWDINAKNGDPSRGLMQTIGSTFNAYAGKLRSRGIYDPLANIYASMRYALSRYGSLASAYNRPGGYANGGRPRAGELAWVGERGPELVRFQGGEEVYDHRTSMSMAAGLDSLRGFARGSSAAARARAQRERERRERAARAARDRARAVSEVRADTGIFTSALRKSAGDINKAAGEMAKDLKRAGGAGSSLAAATLRASAKLQGLAKRRDAVAARIAEAKAFAGEQKKSAADYISLASVPEPMDIQGLIGGLKARQKTAGDFQKRINTLGKRGLNRDMLGQLIAAGPDSELARMLGGASAAQIGQLNKLSASGAKLTTSYGNTMADHMYDSGKQAGRGFLAGLQAQQKDLQREMDRLGDALVKSIKKKLKIRSPSRVTFRVGQQTGAGVGLGLASTATQVAAAAAQVADAAVPPVAPVGPVPVAAQAAGGFAAGQRLRLVVGGREFDAYVEDLADTRVAAGFTQVRRRAAAGSR